MQDKSNIKIDFSSADIDLNLVYKIISEKLKLLEIDNETHDVILKSIQYKLDMLKLSEEKISEDIKLNYDIVNQSITFKFEKLTLILLEEITNLVQTHKLHLSHSEEMTSTKIKNLEKKINDFNHWRFIFTLSVLVSISILAIPDIIALFN